MNTPDPLLDAISAALTAQTKTREMHHGQWSQYEDSADRDPDERREQYFAGRGDPGSPAGDWDETERWVNQ